MPHMTLRIKAYGDMGAGLSKGPILKDPPTWAECVGQLTTNVQNVENVQLDDTRSYLKEETCQWIKLPIDEGFVQSDFSRGSTDSNFFYFDSQFNPVSEKVHNFLKTVPEGSIQGCSEKVTKSNRKFYIAQNETQTRLHVNNFLPIALRVWLQDAKLGDRNDHNSSNKGTDYLDSCEKHTKHKNKQVLQASSETIIHGGGCLVQNSILLSQQPGTYANVALPAIEPNPQVVFSPPKDYIVTDIHNSGPSSVSSLPSAQALTNSLEDNQKRHPSFPTPKTTVIGISTSYKIDINHLRPAVRRRTATALDPTTQKRQSLAPLSIRIANNEMLSPPFVPELNGLQPLPKVGQSLTEEVESPDTSKLPAPLSKKDLEPIRIPRIVKVKGELLNEQCLFNHNRQTTSEQHKTENSETNDCGQEKAEASPGRSEQVTPTITETNEQVDREKDERKTVHSDALQEMPLYQALEEVSEAINPGRKRNARQASKSQQVNGTTDQSPYIASTFNHGPKIRTNRVIKLPSLAINEGLIDGNKPISRRSFDGDVHEKLGVKTSPYFDTKRFKSVFTDSTLSISDNADSRALPHAFSSQQFRESECQTNNVSEFLPTWSVTNSLRQKQSEEENKVRRRAAAIAAEKHRQEKKTRPHRWLRLFGVRTGSQLPKYEHMICPAIVSEDGIIYKVEGPADQRICFTQGPLSCNFSRFIQPFNPQPGEVRHVCYMLENAILHQPKMYHGIICKTELIPGDQIEDYPNNESLSDVVEVPPGRSVFDKMYPKNSPYALQTSTGEALDCHLAQNSLQQGSQVSITGEQPTSISQALGGIDANQPLAGFVVYSAAGNAVNTFDPQNLQCCKVVPLFAANPTMETSHNKPTAEK